MKAEKVLVLVKIYNGELNPFDCASLECALRLGYKDITVMSMCPPSAFSVLKSLTRLGVKAVAISDNGYAGSDTIATSYILSHAVAKFNPDIIFCGKQSVDGDTAQVPLMLAKRLDFKVITRVVDIDDQRVVTRDGQTVLPEKNTIVTCERFLNLRFFSMFSKSGEIEIWDNSVLGLDLNKCGIKGSPTKVKKAYESSVGRRNCTFISSNDLLKTIKESLNAQSTKNVINVKEKLDKVCYVGNVKEIACSIANEVIEIEAKNQSAESIAKTIKDFSPNAVLWEDSDILKLLASEVSVILNVGLCADCISFSIKDGRLIMTRPANGGNITADIECTSNVSFATVRTARKDCAKIVLSVGAGAVDNIEKVKKLAESLHADIACSRKVADSGILPYTSQVGLTGKTVSPNVYVCFGLEGAVQHTCAISGAGKIIAINKDKNARIFDYADYGVVEDIDNLQF